MPYKVYEVDGEWVTAKENEDGSMGKIFGHHGGDKEKAMAQMRALYASESPRNNTQFLQTNDFRTVTDNGVEYLIVSGVPARAQVMNTYLVPANEIIRSLPGWNGTPITIHHPKLNGGSVKVPAPDVAVIGAFYNGTWDAHGQKMIGEYWIDVAKAQKYQEGLQILDLIKNGSILETSTGYWSEDEPNPGEYGGKQYQTIHRNLLPDHIAILPNQVGACSIQDGCGVNRNMAMIQNCADSKPGCDCKFKSAFVNEGKLPPFEKGKLPTICLVGYTFSKGSRTQEQIDSLRAYIQANGIKDPAVLIYKDENIKILDGNHRIAMAEELGIDQVPVKVFNEDYQEIDPEILYNVWKHQWDQGYLVQNYFADHEGRPGMVGGSKPRDGAGATDDNFESDIERLKSRSKQQRKDDIDKLSRMPLKELRHRQESISVRIKAAYEKKDTPTLEALQIMESDLTAAISRKEFNTNQSLDDRHPVLKTKKRSPNMKLEELQAFLATKGIHVNADGEEFQVEETPTADPVPMLSEAELTALKSLAALSPKLNAASLDQALQLAQNFEAQQKAEKDSLILSIKQNGSNPYTDDDLAGMSLPVLMKLNSQMNMSYAGAGPAMSLFGNESVEVLTLPSSLTAKQKEE